MRILFAFAALVGAVMAVSDLVAGRVQDALFGGVIAVVAGLLLWRNLRDPVASRKAGAYATVTFTLDRWPDAPANGTAALVETHRDKWHVALDRMPERQDFDCYGTAQRGWVWVDADGLPEKVKIDFGTTWKTWPVLGAVAVPAR